MSEASFYVGYASRLPADTRRFLLIVAAWLATGALGLAMALAVSFDNPGGGSVQGEADALGALVARPYPMIVSAPDAAHPRGHATLLAGYEKTGVGPGTLALAGGSVAAHGYLVKRGALDMLLVGDDDVKREAAAVAPVAGPSLGRWRVAGEICDGKCYAGAMRPGTGLAHKACALLCVDGGAPPVFVSGAPVEGMGFFLMAGLDGGPVPIDLSQVAGTPVVVEGEIVTMGDLAILKADWTRALRP